MKAAFVQTDRMTPRVTFIGLNYAPERTGIALYATSLTEGLTALGFQVSVITGLPHYPEWRRLPVGDDNFKVAGFRRVQHFVPRRPRLLARSLMEVSFGLAAAVAPWKKPDVVVMATPSLLSSLIVQVRARLQGVPTAVWVQDVYTLGIAQAGQGIASGGLIDRLEGHLVRSATAVVTIHDRFSRYLTSALRLNPQDCTVIRNWSHVSSTDTRDENVRRALGWADDDIVVLHAGNMGAKQGLENVVVASALAAERGSRVRFVLLGHGNQRAKLEQMGDNHRLQFIDPLPDAEFFAALASADILLVNELPGMTEMSVPSKLTTYFATGLPVLGAVDPGSVTADELDASGGSFRIGPADPDALLHEAERIGSNPQLKERGQRNVEYRQRTMSQDAAIRAFADLLRKLCAKRRANPRGQSRFASIFRRWPGSGRR